MSGADLSVTVGDRELAADWTSENPRTRAAVAEALPLSGTASRWGDELYFPTPVDAPREDARAVVAVGAIAYWPRGDALCLFWGATPSVCSGGRRRRVRTADRGRPRR